MRDLAQAGNCPIITLPGTQKRAIHFLNSKAVNRSFDFIHYYFLNMTKTLRFSDLQDRTPAHYQVNGMDLVIIRYDDELRNASANRDSVCRDTSLEQNNILLHMTNALT